MTAEPTAPPTPTPSPGRDPSIALIAFTVFAVLAMTIGVTVAAAGRSDRATTRTGASATATVTLTEFAITPATVTLAAGGSLHVVNGGTTAHNLTVVDKGIATPDLAAGSADDLDVSTLPAGAYKLVCLIPGHADAGMRADLTVAAAAPVKDAMAEMPGMGGASTDPPSASTTMDYARMTKDMLATMAAFPSATKGVGNQPLAPTEVRADGTKVFDLTMEQTDWEVSPGKVVKASTFNGTVPGPRIDLQVGDRVQMRVKNDLPMASDVHLHGINVDNANDGVAPLTQKLIEPGKTFTYSFTADEPAVAMYHPHAHGHLLLPDGMFGVILVGQVPLPLGRTVGYAHIPSAVTISQEIPMVLNDSGVIGYSLNGKSFPATAPIVAKVGDWILVHYYNEGTQIHPMHLHQFDQIVVAKDGFPLDAPYEADTVTIAPGERYTVLVHIDKAGAWVWHCHILPHVENMAGMYGMVTAIIAT